jgi:hypothetical protein
MANLIDNTYFVGDISVPLSSNATLNSNFNAAIARYEDEILRKLLGYTLWKALKVQIDAASYSAPWKDFIEGAEFSFEFNGNTINEKWNGLINDEKVSLIAYYIYYQHRKFNDTIYTGIGETKPKGENSRPASPLLKMVQVNNLMVNLYGNIPNYYRKYCSFSDSGNYEHYDDKPSAYNFLLANIDNYEGWVFKPIGKQNVFGI